ncbi:ABC transporter ATP-binding protein [Citricoccus muralis]|uniref:NitT/TauT family transport system ATP-binding protein/sulfonate transport system ATP-binding protein n=1 Tax=Citricoccus muralis TaxID=169134 RepID=A0A3D9LH90_9MICC|nr:ABC transporter ATP-binding protein [Citricoccus muralis]REE04817.1 NitT/TauT family transport system ATP-binding protein/sulfonate transport system ATP-binding protein [Citricoccus muralis]
MSMTPLGTAVDGTVVLTHLGKHFPGAPLPAVADVNLDIHSGEFVCIVGASGCGKSTVLRMVAGFEQPTDGTAQVSGRDVNGPGPDRGVVFQDYGLFPWLTVTENIAYGPRQARLAKADVQDRTSRALESVGLTRVAKSFPHQLSGGMQQRVAIARVLANRPAVMLMDEPFGALDALTRSGMQQELRRTHHEAGVTILFVTHSIEEAVFLADRVVVMAGGSSHGNSGHVREVVPITLGQDRDPASGEFNEIKRYINGLVHAGNEVPA